jgi:hypothetical protein
MDDPRKHQRWQAVRDAIKRELVDANMDYPEGWHGGWLSPGSDDMADAMLNGLADVAVDAAFPQTEQK